MNAIHILGRLTADIELKTTTSGKTVTSFTVASRRARVKDTTDFITCVAWDKTAELLAQFVKKGDLVTLYGELQTRKYQDKDGNNRVAFEVMVRDLEFCESRNKKDIAEQEPTNGSNIAHGEKIQGIPEATAFTQVANDEDLPF